MRWISSGPPSPILRALTAFMIVMLAGYAAIVAAMYVNQRALLYPGAKVSANGETGPAPWGERVNVQTADGERLAALYLSAAGSRPTILLFPGNGDDVANYAFLAKATAARELGFFALSYRGYPGSTGSPTESGLLMDGLAAFDWLNANGVQEIVLVGRSLGSGVAVATAVERTAKGLVLVSAYDSVSAVAQGRYPFLPVGLLIKDSFHSDHRIVQVSEPKLFLHGDLDTVVPMASGQALFAAASEPKRFVIVRGSRHNDIWNRQVVDEINDFADAVTKPNG